MPIIYTNTNPYQPNGYTPIQYGTGNGVVGNTFMTNFPYQDNGYAPVQVGIGTLPTPYNVDTTQVGTGTLPTPYTVDTTQTGFNIGPSNEYYNTSQYSDNISSNQGSEEYADWRTQFPLLEKIYREPKVLRTYTKFPNAGKSSARKYHGFPVTPQTTSFPFGPKTVLVESPTTQTRPPSPRADSDMRRILSLPGTAVG